jgi:hypothetical protein
MRQQQRQRNISTVTATDDTLAAIDDEFSRRTDSELGQLDGADGQSRNISDVLYEEEGIFDDDNHLLRSGGGGQGPDVPVIRPKISREGKPSRF